MNPLSRRTLLQILPAGLVQAAGEQLPPVRALTRGPKFHWFGYYDKLQFDPTGRYVLGMQSDFENRSPQPDDEIRLGMIDLQDGDKWIEFGRSRAWCWQQGCMLQWLPGSKTEVIWNGRDASGFVSHILDVKTRKTRKLPGPIYAVSPDARWAVSPDFRRLHKLRPGYGYAGVPDPNEEVLAPKDAGLWRMDLRNGKRDLLLTFEAASRIPSPHAEILPAAKHWFNHLLYSPDGSRFIFLHRWRAASQPTFITRMFTCNGEGKDLYVLDPYGKTSHFIWRDPKHVLAWANHPSHGDKFYLYEDRTSNVQAVGPDKMLVNGHCTYLPGNRWILNDTYPDKQRLQHPYLYDTQSDRRAPLGHFNSPPEYTGEWRCDQHPRFSPDGTKVVIDSPHGGNGRQLYLIDISGIVRG